MTTIIVVLAIVVAGLFALLMFCLLVVGARADASAERAIRKHDDREDGGDYGC